MDYDCLDKCKRKNKSVPEKIASNLEELWTLSCCCFYTFKWVNSVELDIWDPLERHSPLFVILYYTVWNIHKGIFFFLVCNSKTLTCCLLLFHEKTSTGWQQATSYKKWFFGGRPKQSLIRFHHQQRKKKQTNWPPWENNDQEDCLASSRVCVFEWAILFDSLYI